MSPAEQLAGLQTWRHEFSERVERERQSQAQTNLDVEQRMRRLERALYVCTGLGVAAQVLLKVIH